MNPTLTIQHLLTVVMLQLLFLTCASGQEWEEFHGDQLPELTFERVRSLALDTGAVWIAGEGGLTRWNRATSKFEHVEGMRNKNVVKVEAENGLVYALTDGGKLYSVRHEGLYIVHETVNLFVTDFSLKDGKVAMSTLFSGLYVMDGNTSQHYDTTGSFIQENSLRSVTWFGDLIACGGSQGLYLSDGRSFNTSNGLTGEQVYRLDEMDSKLYLAHEQGIQALTVEGWATPSGDSLSNSVVYAFYEEDGDPRIATDLGLYHLDGDDWVRTYPEGDDDKTVVHGVSADSIALLAYKDHGISIQYGAHKRYYQKTPETLVIQKICLVDHNLYGVAKGDGCWWFHYDSVLQRLKVIKPLNVNTTASNRLLVNRDEQPYLFNYWGCYNITTDSMYMYPTGHANPGRIFFSPETGKPAYFKWHKGLWVLTNDSFRYQVHTPYIGNWSVGPTRQNDRGEVYFKCDAQILRWTGNNENDVAVLEEVVDFFPHGYRDLYFTGDDRLFLTSWEFMEVFGDRPTILDHTDPDYVTPEYALTIGTHHVAVKSGRNFYVYATDSLRQVDRIELPSGDFYKDHKVDRTNRFIWLANDSAIYRYPYGTYNLLPHSTPLVFYPNPAQDHLTVEVSAPGSDEALIRIHSMQGNVLYHESIALSSDRHKHQVSLPDLPQGMYMISVNAGSHQQSEVFVIE